MGKSYTEKLADPAWQKRRLEIFSRDNWTCQGCGATKEQLEIHHTVYIYGFEPWQYPDDMLITCCHNCHGSEQIRFKNETYLLNSLKMAGFLAGDLLALSVMVSRNEKFSNWLRTVARKLSNPNEA